MRKNQCEEWGMKNVIAEVRNSAEGLNRRVSGLEAQVLLGLKKWEAVNIMKDRSKTSIST